MQCWQYNTIMACIAVVAFPYNSILWSYYKDLTNYENMSYMATQHSHGLHCLFYTDLNLKALILCSWYKNLTDYKNMSCMAMQYWQHNQALGSIAIIAFQCYSILWSCYKDLTNYEIMSYMVMQCLQYNTIMACIAVVAFPYNSILWSYYKDLTNYENMS